MTKNLQLVQITADDWEGIYFNGLLKTEGHRVPFRDLMEIIVEEGGRIEYWATIEADADWLNDLGNLPDTLREVKFAENEIIPAGLVWA